MKIVYTLPSINIPHGGYRIVLEHLIRLKKQFGHDTSLFIESGEPNCDWYGNIDIPITKDRGILGAADIIVFGSPHTRYQPRPGQKVFSFVQMAEHLFRPNDMQWKRQCKAWYESPYPKIYGAEWIGKLLKGQLHYLPDGINTDHFPIESPVKDGRTVLVEGWECSNPAKDTEAYGPKVAEKLKEEGYKILAYGFLPLKRYSHVPAEYYYRPTLDKMNELYRRASVLIKATKYDSRSLSPVEAATKGCVTARAIVQGDDYLIDRVNSRRTNYVENELYEAGKEILQSPLAICIRQLYIPEWPPIIEQLNYTLTK